MVHFYDPDQERDENGRWGSAGGPGKSAGDGKETGSKGEKPSLDDLRSRLSGLSGKSPSPEELHDLARTLASFKEKEIKQLAATLGIRAGGNKMARAEKLVSEAARNLSFRQKQDRLARQAGVPPAALHQFAREIRSLDKQAVERVGSLLKQTRQLYRSETGGLLTRNHKAFRDGDPDGIRNFDRIARTMAGVFPELLGAHGYEHHEGHDDKSGEASERLFDFLAGGPPKRLSRQAAYDQALQHLTSQGSESSRRRKKSDEEIPFASFASAKKNSDGLDERILALLLAAGRGESPDLLDAIAGAEDEEDEGTPADSDRTPVDPAAAARNRKVLDAWIRTKTQNSGAAMSAEQQSTVPAGSPESPGWIYAEGFAVPRETAADYWRRQGLGVTLVRVCLNTSPVATPEDIQESRLSLALASFAGGKRTVGRHPDGKFRAAIHTDPQLPPVLSYLDGHQQGLRRFASAAPLAESHLERLANRLRLHVGTHPANLKADLHALAHRLSRPEVHALSARLGLTPVAKATKDRLLCDIEDHLQGKMPGGRPQLEQVLRYLDRLNGPLTDREGEFSDAPTAPTPEITPDHLDELGGMLRGLSLRQINRLAARLSGGNGGPEARAMQLCHAGASAAQNRRDWTARARLSDVEPRALHRLAIRYQSADCRLGRQARELVRQARELHGKLNPSAAPLDRRHPAFNGCDHSRIEGLDQLARRLAPDYPQLLGDPQTEAPRRLFCLLAAGGFPAAGGEHAYEQAIRHLRSRRAAQGVSPGDPPMTGDGSPQSVSLHPDTRTGRSLPPEAAGGDESDSGTLSFPDSATLDPRVLAMILAAAGGVTPEILEAIADLPSSLEDQSHDEPDFEAADPRPAARAAARALADKVLAAELLPR